MYFYKQKGRQCLDLRGDLILTHNDAIAKARVKSAGPSHVRNASYTPVASLGRLGKLKATWAAVRFIWGPSQALTVETIEEEGL